MKFKCNQSDLSKSLNIVSKAITNRTTIPILKGILLSTKENQLKLTTSDLDLSISKKIDCQTLIDGETVVISRLFMEIIRKLPNEELTLELIDNKLNISCSNFSANILTFTSDEFPRIQESESNTIISIPKDLFKDMIKKSSFCASVDDSKGVIIGVLIEIDNNSIKMVALDGFRMALINDNIEYKEKNKNIIIPSRILNEILKILSETEDDNINLCIEDKKAIFTTETSKIVTRLLDGNFINYNDIIPSQNNISIVINRKELIQSIERASLFSKEGKNNLIKFTINDNLLQIDSNSEEGNIEEYVQIEKSGEDIVIGFNSKYVLESLKAIEDDLIKMELNNSVSPCLIKPTEGNLYTYLVLPVRISGN